MKILRLLFLIIFAYPAWAIDSAECQRVLAIQTREHLKGVQNSELRICRIEPQQAQVEVVHKNSHPLKVILKRSEYDEHLEALQLALKEVQEMPEEISKRPCTNPMSAQMTLVKAKPFSFSTCLEQPRAEMVYKLTFLIRTIYRQGLKRSGSDSR